MNIDIGKCWSEALTLLKDTQTEVTYNSLLLSLTPVKFENNTLTLMTDDDFIKATLTKRYQFEINRCLRIVTEMDIDVHIASPEDQNPSNKSKKTMENYSKTNLRHKYTFETFVKGKSNELAYAAACAVAEAPGQSSYNPLFLYGGVGLGKTHLIQSIGNYVIDQNPDSRVIYQSTETFTNELIIAIREKKQAVFKEKYRSCDVLLLDDIQFLERTVETQEEMFHTFNTLHNYNKQIVLTSDLPPKELTAIEKRITTRFGMGLIVDVTLPDYETRKAILEKKLFLEKLDIPEAVKELIIRNITSNIRDLEGALNKVTAYARLTKTPITLELATLALKDQLEATKRPEITIEHIQRVTAEYFNISVEDINGKKRTKNIVFPRQIAMYICRKILEDKSLPQIGVAFNRDHSTVVHGCEKISQMIEKSDELNEQILSIERKIKFE